MKSILRKIILSVIFMIIIGGFLPELQVQAEVKTGTMGDNDGFVWTYDEEKKLLTFTGKDTGLYKETYYEEDNKTYKSSPFESVDKQVQKIVIKDCAIIGSAEHLFASLRNLESIIFDNFDTSEVTKMGMMFSGCNSLKSLDVSGFDTSKVTNMSWMFYDCNKLTNLDVSNFDTSKVTNMTRMFYKCSSLTSVDVSCFDMTNVTDISFMFAGCEALTSLNLSNFKLTNCSSSENTLSGMALRVIETPEEMPESLSMDLFKTFVDPNSKETTKLTSDFCKTTLVNKYYLVRKINLNQTSLTLKTGESTKLQMTILPEDAAIKTVTWMSSDSDVATVDASGNVKAVAPGTATITVTAKDGSAKSVSCTVTVPRLVEGITLNKADLNMKTTESVTLTATIAPFNASDKGLTWKSSDITIATVDASGKITAMAPGTATITVTAMDGSGKSATCSVSVTQLVTGITLDQKSLNLKEGGSVTLVAYIAPANASNKAVNWKSSDTSVATVDSNGKVTAVALGSTTISVTAKDGSGKSASCIIIVKEENSFADVKETSWQYSFVKFVYNHNIMAGKGKTEEGKIIFDPDNYMTRAEFVQTLYNKEGKPAVTYKATFTDVPEGQWYTNAILWASQNGIATGKGDRFDISGKITREEVATILYKYATNYKKFDTSGRASLDAYGDTDSISSWAVNNMKWAIHYGIMKGRGNLLAPGDKASRAECATMLKNFIDAYNK